MSHKVNPELFRTKRTEDWDSRWLDPEHYSEKLKEDFGIRKFLKKRLKEAAVEKIEIERFPGEMKIIISSSRPGLIIGRRGKGVEQLKRDLERKIKIEGKLKLEIEEIKNPWAKAQLCSDWAAKQIERRTPYRRVLKSTLSKIMGSKGVKGARVEVAGRLNGLEFSRREWLEEGKLPRQTLRANIDYGKSEAKCSYGTVGVKVLIYKGEEF